MMERLFYEVLYSIEKINAKSFFNYINEYKRIQEEVLLNYVYKNKDTIFGKEHNFKNIRSIKDFKKYVPVRDYKGFIEYIYRIKSGEENILTSDKVLFLHPTGGTTGTKLIPYTKRLRMEFQRALSVWFYDVFKNFPEIKKGKTYWVITPPGKKLKGYKGLKVGFSEDSEYFGIKGKFLSSIQCVPFGVSKIEDIEIFKYITALYLVREEKLTWISLWSPTFLEIIFEAIEKNIEFILKSIYDGKIYLPEKKELSYRFRIHKDKERTKQVENALKLDKKKRYHSLWKWLNLISLWMSGESYYPAKRLKKILPYVYFQPKGLILTEGIVSIPLEEIKGCIPCFLSHYIEFLKDNEIRNIWEIEEGEKYRVVITTGAGLYRYDTGDIIEVKGFWKNLPIIEFKGRAGLFSDIVGEKLSGYFVNECIENAINKIRINFKFLMIAPSEIKGKYLYILFIESGEKREKINKFCKEVEKNLMENFYYKNAVEIGQLNPLRAVNIKNGLKKYINYKISKGVRLGDIKPLKFEKDRELYRVLTKENF